MPRVPCMNWNPADFLSDPRVAELTPTAELLYRRLLERVHLGDGKLSRKSELLRRFAHPDALDTFTEDWALVSRFFEPHPDDAKYLTHPRVLRELRESAKWSPGGGKAVGGKTRAKGASRDDGGRFRKGSSENPVYQQRSSKTRRLREKSESSPQMRDGPENPVYQQRSSKTPFSPAKRKTDAPDPNKAINQQQSIDAQHYPARCDSGPQKGMISGPSGDQQNRLLVTSNDPAKRSFDQHRPATDFAGDPANSSRGRAFLRSSRSSLESSSSSTPEKTKSTPGKTVPPTFGPAELAALYRETLPDLPQPTSPLTPTIRKALAAALRRDGADAAEWRAYLESVRDMPHLIGENDRGWRATLVWLIGPKNRAKVEAGNYLASKPRTPKRGSLSGMDYSLDFDDV